MAHPARYAEIPESGRVDGEGENAFDVETAFDNGRNVEGFTTDKPSVVPRSGCSSPIPDCPVSDMARGKGAQMGTKGHDRARSDG